MSAKMVERVFKASRTTGTARVAMLYLAWKHHDKKGYAFPPRDKMVEAIGCSRRNLVYTLQAIEELGELLVIRRHGRRTVDNRTEYHLFPDPAKVQRLAHSKVQPGVGQSASRERAATPAPKKERQLGKKAADDYRPGGTDQRPRFSEEDGGIDTRHPWSRG